MTLPVEKQLASDQPSEKSVPLPKTTSAFLTKLKGFLCKTKGLPFETPSSFACENRRVGSQNTRISTGRVSPVTLKTSPTDPRRNSATI